jgi:amino-acid N-acetyltransferase
MGLGKRVVRFLMDKARKQGFSRVFVLTVGASDWFETLGFREAPVESLPARKYERYNRARNSRVFAFELN